MTRIDSCRIVIGSGASYNERRAAAIISKYVRIVTGKNIGTVTDDLPPRPPEIIVGRTSRPADPSGERSRDRVWERVSFTDGGSLYLTGLGLPPEEEPPYNTAYRLIDDGCVGTVMAAYSFVEKVLGCDFLNEAYIPFPFDPDVSIPDGWRDDLTLDRILDEVPDDTEGPLFCALGAGSDIMNNRLGSVIKTRGGKLIVIDAGRGGDAEHLLKIIEKLWDGKDGRPVISLWLFSHLHTDHYGAISEIASRPEMRERLRVERFCHRLLPAEFYTSISREKLSPHAIRALDIMTHFDRYFEGCRVTQVSRGDLFEVDGISFEVIRTPDIVKGALMNTNDSSVVYRMTAEGQTWMLLGDAEWVASGELLALSRDRLKADVVQVGHHGCGNVSKEVYREIGARAAVWHVSERFFHSESGEALNSHNTGVIRTRAWLRELGIRTENEYVLSDHIFLTKLPMEIK